MTPSAQQFADRLRSALGFHTRKPRHRGTAASADTLTVRRATPSEAPGEEFARRLRAAIDA